MTMPKGRPPLKPKYIDGVAYWQCAACKDWRPAKRFNKWSGKANGLHSYCRECQVERNRKDYVVLRIKQLKAEVRRLEKEQ
jgi:hypothetical protein